MDGTAYFWLAVAFLPSLCALLGLSFTGLFLSAAAVVVAVFAAQTSLSTAGIIWLGAWVLAVVPVAMGDNRRRRDHQHREMMREMRETREALERQVDGRSIVYTAEPEKKRWWRR